MKSLFYRVDPVTKEPRKPSLPAHSFEPHFRVARCCDFCGYQLSDHPWAPEQIRAAMEELRIMALDPTDQRLIAVS